MWLFEVYTRNLLLLLFPCSALVYVWHRWKGSHPHDETAKSEKTPWRAALAVASLLALGAVWAPARTVALSHPRDLDAVQIELSRGPCFGSCPVYTITVRGDGRVVYIGRQGHSRRETRKSGTIGREKIEQILETLDRARFTALDDRAFSWGFDSPSVGVGVSVDGKTKRVVSDAGFVGSPNGRQDRFVQATREIDGILESTEWSQCAGEECASPTPR
jgi:Domain of unknown function (DUF6438)